MARVYGQRSGMIDSSRLLVRVVEWTSLSAGRHSLSMGGIEEVHGDLTLHYVPLLCMVQYQTASRIWAVTPTCELHLTILKKSKPNTLSGLRSVTSKRGYKTGI